MPFVITDNLWNYSNLPKTIFIQHGVILLAVVFFWTRKVKEITLSRTLIAYMVFLAWAGLSIFWAINKYEAVTIFTHWVMCGMFLFLVHNLNINRTVVFMIVFVTAWIVALFGLGQHFWQLDWVEQSYAPASTFANRNLAGAYILMAMPLGVGLMRSLYQFIQKRKSIVCLESVYFLILYIAILTMAVFMYVSHCRLGMVGIVVLGSYYFIKYLRKTKHAVISIVSVSLFLAGAFYINRDFFDEGYKVKTERLWNTVEIIKKHPVAGVGVGNFKIHYDQYSPLEWNTNNAHNDYLQILCELGIVGTWFAFLVVLYAFHGAFKRCDGYSTSLKAGLGAFMCVAMFSFPMALPADPFICALYLGMLKV